MKEETCVEGVLGCLGSLSSSQGSKTPGFGVIGFKFDHVDVWAVDTAVGVEIALRGINEGIAKVTHALRAVSSHPVPVALACGIDVADAVAVAVIRAACASRSKKY
jgi:hypothetical protein